MRSESVFRRVREPHCRTRTLIYIVLKIALAAPWRVDYRGQSGCWENSEGQLPGLQVRNDSGLTQSGGSEINRGV